MNTASQALYDILQRIGEWLEEQGIFDQSPVQADLNSVEVAWLETETLSV
jgi:hypothetical protein